MGIVVKSNHPRQFTPTQVKRVRAEVHVALSRGEAITSMSGQSLALAVEYCEEHRRPYLIHAVPGVGYALTSLNWPPEPDA